MRRRRASSAAVHRLTSFETLRAGPPAEPRIGLALGGGFARGIAHAGVLRVFEQHGIPLHCITGVSAGAIVAAAYASDAEADEIARIGCSMRFRDVAKWSICRMGVMGSERMKRFLEGLLKTYRFEDMRIPLGVVATDLCTGKAVSFRDTGDVFLPIRASCAYPGLFQPVACDDRLLVDGAMSMEIPAVVARELGATHVISVALPAPACRRPPKDVCTIDDVLLHLGEFIVGQLIGFVEHLGRGVDLADVVHERRESELPQQRALEVERSRLRHRQDRHVHHVGERVVVVALHGGERHQ